MSGDNGIREVLFVRQDAEGFMSLCMFQVHNVTRAAIMKTVGKEFSHLEPGFMAPFPCFMCVSLDWLFPVWYARNEKAISEESSVLLTKTGSSQKTKKGNTSAA